MLYPQAMMDDPGYAAGAMTAPDAQSGVNAAQFFPWFRPFWGFPGFGFPGWGFGPWGFGRPWWGFGFGPWGFGRPGGFGFSPWGFGRPWF